MTSIESVPAHLQFSEFCISLPIPPHTNHDDFKNGSLTVQSGRGKEKQKNFQNIFHLFQRRSKEDPVSGKEEE